MTIPKQLEELVLDRSESSRDSTFEKPPILQYRGLFKRSDPGALAQSKSQFSKLFGYRWRADLHTHSTCSDGSFTPHELIDIALVQGLQGISITDHDTCAAYHQVADYAKEKQIEILPGAEFSAVLGDESVHILAYAFDPMHPAITQLVSLHKERRKRRAEKILEKLDSLNISVAFPTPLPESIGRPHIAEALIQQGIVHSVTEAFNQYLGKGKPAYHQGKTPTVSQTLRAIHEANGLALIAHPHLIRKQRIIQHLLNYSFDGLEGYYALFADQENQKWVDIAKKKKWIVTGGSDFHGTAKPHIPLGASWTPQETFQRLLDHFHGQ